MSGKTRSPGWYSDPWGTEGERYYDGTAWARSVRRPGGLDDAPAETSGPPDAPLRESVAQAPAATAAAPAPAATGPAVPPGWHPDPWGTAALRWWDGTRWTGHVTGSVTVPEPAAEREASRWARLAMLWAGPAQGVAAIVSAYQAVWIAEHWDELTQPGGAVPEGGNALASTVGQIAALAVLAAGVLFLMWFHRSAKFAASAGLPARRRPGLAVASFVIPIVNFWWPYQSTCDLLPAGHPARRKVLRWWLLWIGCSVGGIAILASAFVADVLLATVTALTVGLALLAAVAAREVIEAVADAHDQLAASAHG